ncbi:macrophage mannose receptor 1, partial [Nephila pilipes]
MVHSKNKLCLNAETCDRGSGKETGLAMHFRYFTVTVINKQMKIISSTVRKRAATMDKSRIFPFALLFLSICNTALGCNLDWFLYQGKCYKYFTTTADFRMARKYCQVFKADLGYVYQFADYLMNFASETRFWVREDSYIETAVTETPGCPYLLNRKVDNTDCNNMLGFICESPYESTASHCPSDWLLYDSKCYKIVEQQKNYTESLTACSSEGGQLAVLDDETKEKNAQAVIIGNDNLFLVDATFDNETFKWSSGKPFTPACSVCTNFTLNGNCLGMKSSSSHPTMFQWDNVDCNANNSFLCVMAAIENTTTTTLPPTKATPRKLCPIGYNWKAYPDSSNYCFWETTYETERLNWYQARQFCQGYGGDLATYSSSNEEDHGLGGAKGHYKGLWFGLRRGEDDVLRWVDGMNLNYTNWKNGEPNLRSNKYCASHALGSARWELDYCGVRRWFICKAPK